MFDPPECANHGCPNRVPRERWLWASSSAATCSLECAMAMTREGRLVGDGGEVRRCERAGCHGVVKRKGQRFCSGHCARKAQCGEVVGDEAMVRPGDRWEKIAPAMTYTPALRDQQIRSLYHEEINRR